MEIFKSWKINYLVFSPQVNFLCNTAAAKFTYNPPLSLLKPAQDFSIEMPNLTFCSQNKVDWECWQHKSLSTPFLSLSILCGHWSDNSSSNPWLKGRCLRKPPFTLWNCNQIQAALPPQSIQWYKPAVQGVWGTPASNSPPSSTGKGVRGVTLCYHSQQAPASLNCPGCSYHWRN